MFAINTVGDYGGGAMLLAFGVVCGLLEARASGRGQVIDAAMVDGAALLTAPLHGLHAPGSWSEVPGTNLLDSGAHFYEVYRTSDGRHIAVGAIEPQFYRRLLELLGIRVDEMPQWDRERWPEFKRTLAELFATRTAAAWAELLEGEDACVHGHPRAVRGSRGPAPEGARRRSSSWTGWCSRRRRRGSAGRPRRRRPPRMTSARRWRAGGWTRGRWGSPEPREDLVADLSRLVMEEGPVVAVHGEALAAKPQVVALVASELGRG